MIARREMSACLARHGAWVTSISFKRDLDHLVGGSKRDFGSNWCKGMTKLGPAASAARQGPDEVDHQPAFEACCTGI